jgi:GntR family transcriptional regulator of arabinose operon
MITLKRKVQYVEVADKIRNWIKSGRCKPGTPIMSCRDIARNYDVSVKTVRNAVKLLVDENLLSPVQGGGTFVCDNSESKRQLNIGCAISSLSHHSDSIEYSQRLRQSTLAAVDYLMSNKCSVRYIPGIVIHNYSELQEYISGLDGLLISVLDVNVSGCVDLHKLPIPVVIFMGENEFNLPFSQVVPDHFSAMRKAFSRLNPEDFSSLVIVYNNYPNHIARRDAFAACAREGGFDETWIEFHESQEGEAYNSGLKIADMPPRTLICTTSAMLTIPIYNALGDHGMNIGRDFDMISYDSLESMQTRYGSSAAITAIDYSHDKASKLAAELLIKEIRGKRDFHQVIKMPTELYPGKLEHIYDNQ